MIDKLEKILEFRRTISKDRSFERFVGAGIRKDEILNRTSFLKWSFPDEIISLYEWHNGVEEVSAFLQLLSLEDAVELYELRMEMHLDDPDLGLWKDSWFPILDLNGNVQICVELEARGDSPIILIDLEFRVESKIFDSFEKMLDFILECIDEGVFSWNEMHGFIEVKDGTDNELRGLYQEKKSKYCS